MKFSFDQLRLKVLFIFSFILLNSCSKDSENPAETTVTVSTSDFLKTMDENPINGQSIGTVSGSTNEGSVTFSITEQDPAGAFSIDASSGELKVADETIFDFEINPILTGNIKISNGNVSENSLVIIYLNDIEDDNIFDGRISLKTQAELNDFGANNYTHITGQLVIGDRYGLGFSDITELSPLSSLISVGENLYISGNQNLTNLNGLDNLEYVGSHLNIFDNPSLNSLAELNKLKTVTMDFNIYQNQILSNLDGLAIKHIGGILNINYNPSLTNIQGLSELIIVGSIKINSNPQLTSLKGFENITEVSTLSINNNDILPNMEGLENLTHINKVLSIGYCNLFTNLNELQNVSSNTITEIYITYNNALQSMAALSNFQAAERIIISNNPSLVNLQGLENMQSANEIYIYENASITDLSGLNNLTTANYLSIGDNPNLSSITGLENLNTILSSFFIQKNPLLTNMDSLNNLDIIGNDLNITENMSLTNLCGLQTVVENNGPGGPYNVYGNGYNPTRQDILDGNCSL